MKLILTQDVDNVGNEGDVVDVKPGFGRNFLIPQKLAVTFSKSQLKQVEEKRSHEDRKIDRQKDVLLDLLSKIADLNITVKMKSEDGEKLFGSITKLDADGFFLKSSYNRVIFINKREIKDFQIISKISKPKPVKKEKADTTKKTSPPGFNEEIIDYEAEIDSNETREEKKESIKTTFSPNYNNETMEDEVETEQIKKKKEVLLGGWYGFPHIEKINGNPDRTLGPLGFTADLLFNNNDFSLGIDYIYAQSFSEYYGGFGITSQTERWHRIQLRANIGLKSMFYDLFRYELKKIHPYIGLGAGTNSRIITYNENGFINSYNNANFDFSIRICGGIRFDLSDNISFGTELGIGGGLIRGALYFKP